MEHKQEIKNMQHHKMQRMNHNHSKPAEDHEIKDWKKKLAVINF